MELMLPVNIPDPGVRLHPGASILSIGSCFTEHIGTALQELKFRVLQNPSGILFDPVSVCRSLQSYLQPQPYSEADVFYLNEAWHSWNHHGRFSGTDRDAVIGSLNAAQAEAHEFLKSAGWLIITLGSSFSYRLADEDTRPAQPLAAGGGVANCHRAPAGWFRKHLLTIDETVSALDNTLHMLFRFNPALRIIFTISPVRHIRDGVVENNRSKARLLEAVHHLVGKFDKLYYFPSYELVVDILRDYRFYAEDLVHPNYLATGFVLEHFLKTYVSEEDRKLLEEIRRLNIARKHKPSFPDTEAHQKFLAAHLEKATRLQATWPSLDFQKEIQYFGNTDLDPGPEQGA
ncbi:GSCFA domain-containing protein [Flaviaesturariibacter flavus]|uniref:GSCFA domain-containing protein n=1 Tax=Flaviaesturariibacter flavus TaxID=2502780 RepID=A0A4R1BNM3_9BACT|nr:GSCFA domain-containing protein [Flaviaesturariibacter flavus]TCJ19220.1 GSCFA domain-containing protein [Flaviaesturariibacter flavus]